MLVSGAPVGFPFVNARRGISELSFGVDPLNPESDAQARRGILEGPLFP